MSAAFALRAAIRARLLDDANLTAILKGRRVYDEVPRGEQSPHVLLDAHESRAISGGGTAVEEHRLTIAAVSREVGLEQALRIAAAVQAALDDALLAVLGHHLVSLEWTATDIRRTEGRFRNALVRLRAVTEPLVE